MSSEDILKIALVGRPNVGKSTLFNRLVGKKLALVDDQPGVTRDRRESIGKLFDLEFKLVDTAGFDYSKSDDLIQRIQAQTDVAIIEADLIMFLIDGRTGVIPEDKNIAAILRKLNKPLLLVANKSETKLSEHHVLEAYSLGFGEPISISAEHGQGLDGLYDGIEQIAFTLNKKVKKTEEDEEDTSEYDYESDKPKGPFKITILGRPNAGKSTLINRYLGENRLLAGPMAGLTRDAIRLSWQYKGQEIELVDTAGMRKRAKVIDKLEKLSVADGLKALQFAHAALLLLDATIALEKQDLTIANRIIDEGRILIIALNKWDLVSPKQRKEILEEMEWRVQHVMPQVRGVAYIPISAESGTDIYKPIEKALELYSLWNSRISTGKLNRWLEHVESAHPPPMIDKKRIRLKYMTQIKSRPPTFVLFVSKPVEFPDSYISYLRNSLRETFNLPGIPLRIQIRGGKNPYVKN